jgi:hypothetical protein
LIELGKTAAREKRPHGRNARRHVYGNEQASTELTAAHRLTTHRSTWKYPRDENFPLKYGFVQLPRPSSFSSRINRTRDPDALWTEVHRLRINAFSMQKM